MRFAVRSFGSLRTLLIVMIAAPVAPTIASSILILVRVAHGANAAASIAQIALAGMGMRILGGGVALWAAGRLIRATRLLSRAAGLLEAGAAPSETRSGIGEIDNVLQAIGEAAQSLRRRSEAHQRAERARCYSEERFSDFAETGSDWYWETDRQHRFSYLSDRIRMFGQDPTSRLGRARWELVAEAGSDPEKWRNHRATLDRHEPFREFAYTRKVGNDPVQTVSVSGKPIFDASGEFCGYRGTARDISEQMRTERELLAAKAGAEAASLAKSRFLANMSHELRTPLNAILGFSEMLERGTAGALQDRQQEYIGYIHQSGSHLLDIINEILDLAKIDAGKLDLEDDSPIELRALAGECITLVAERAAAGALKLSLQLDNAIPRLVADPTRLKQILLNLLDNAVKFTDAGGAVVLAIRRGADGGVEFEVSDTGLGMTAAEIEIALEPFGQVDTGLARRREGTGLGLPLARRLTELHGGALEIDSEPGRGTRMVVKLPPHRVLAGSAAPLAAAEAHRGAPIPVGAPG